MPEFFPFIPGTETSRTARQHASDASPLLGRFRAVPRNQQRRHSASALGLLSNGSGSGSRGSVHVGYGALIASELGRAPDDDDNDNDIYDGNDGVGRAHKAYRVVRRNVEDLFVAPRQTAVKRVVERWWTRWGVLVFLPAALVSNSSTGHDGFCIIPQTTANNRR